MLASRNQYATLNVETRPLIATAMRKTHATDVRHSVRSTRTAVCRLLAALDVVVGCPGARASRVTGCCERLPFRHKHALCSKPPACRRRPLSWAPYCKDHVSNACYRRSPFRPRHVLCNMPPSCRRGHSCSVA